MTVSTIYKLAAEMTTRGNLPAGIQAANKQLKTMQSNLGSVGASVSGLGRSIGSGAFQTAAAVTRGAGAAAAVTAGAAAGMMAKGGLEAAANAEKMQNTLAGTLQLYNHSAGATDQIGQNVKVAAQAMRELNKIADSSPGELDDVSKMFQNMLPGAAAVTGDMARIMKMTQNLALFTPTLTGGDFITSGAQMGRILTGSAGPEMDTWKRLAPVIADVGSQMKKTAGAGKVLAEGLTGDKLTMAFNKLSGEDRMRLVEESFKRGGPALAAMYANSWEGASASALSSVKRVRNAVMAPIFDRIKSAAIRHTSNPNALLGSNRTEKMIKIATSIGVLMAGPVERMLERISQAFRYVQENTYAVANRIYQVFQVAGGILRAAAAYMLSRMMIGAGLMAAGAAARGASAVGRGVAGAYGMASKSVKGIKNATTAVSTFLKTSSPVANVLGMFTSIAKGVMGFGAFLAVIVPLVLVAAAAFALLAIPLLAAAGIAAYVASKWGELSASVGKVFQDGTITLRPLIIAVMVLWEKLKKIGEAFLGASTGASMMQNAINMAASVVNGLSEAVVILAGLAAGFLEFIGNAMDWWNGSEGVREQRARVLYDVSKEKYANFGEALKDVDKRKAEGWYGDDRNGAMKLAANLREAAATWRSSDIKNINEADITSWTDTVTAAITDAFKPSEDDKKTKKGPSVNIGNLYMPVDLRGEDPDRALSALIVPLENMAKRPTASSADPVGGL